MSSKPKKYRSILNRYETALLPNELKFGDLILEHSRTVRRAKARTLARIGALNNRVTESAVSHQQWRVRMKVIADLCVVPMGIGVSVSREVAVCERILAEAGLKTKLHAYGTN